MTRRIAFGVVACALLESGCSTPVIEKPASEVELAREAASRGQLWTAQFEPFLRLRRDPDTSVYLRELATRIVDVSPVLREAPIGVFLYSDLRSSDRKQALRAYSMPGNRIYLPLTLLRTLEYEAQTAALIAWELGHLLLRHVVVRWGEQEVTESKQLFGSAGIMRFSLKEEWEAVRAAVELLYQSGFDARGMSSLLLTYQALGADSPYARADLEQLIERTRLLLAEKVPIRNPIVRSEAYIRIHERIKTLTPL